MNLLLERSKFVEYYTYLDPIFAAAPELAKFTYLVSDLEIAGEIDERVANGPLVIQGRELRAIVEENKVQFIWAVLSAFDYHPKIPDQLPYADGNSGFWVGSPRPQLRDAKLEIVCWDSGATLFIGLDPSIAEKIRQRFPDIQDLDAYNENGANQTPEPTAPSGRGSA